MNSTKSVTTIVRLLPQVVAALVSLSALGYFIGWGEASVYYATLGAPWAISMLPPFALLQLSASIILMMVMFGFVAFMIGIPVKALGWITAVILFAALALLFVPPGRLSTDKVYVAAEIGGYLYAAAAGLAIVELVGLLKLANWSFQKRHFHLVYIAILFGLFVAPQQLGRARAEYHLDPSSTALPAVDLPGSPTDLKWRLVHIIDGRALLISPAKERQNSAFRVIEAKDLPSIATVLSSSRK